MVRLLTGGGTTAHLKLAPSTGKRGHDCRYGNRSNGGNVFVRTSFQLAKHNHLPIAWRQRLECVGKLPATVRGYSKHFGTWVRGSMELFIEFDHILHSTILL